MHRMYRNTLSEAGTRCGSVRAAHLQRTAPRLRRLSNTFFKLLYRWSHSSAFRHSERLWHGVSICRDEFGLLKSISIDGIDIPLLDPQQLSLPSSGICHLIATGNSVNEIDYRVLNPVHVLGVNGAVALQDKYPVRFAYYCIIDTGFVRKRFDLVLRVIEQNLVLFTTPLVLWHIAQLLPLTQIRCRICVVENVLYPVRQRARSMRELFASSANADLVRFDERRALGFSWNIRRGIFDSHTVAYAALQILASLGFQSIALHGIDLYDAARTPRFYESAADMQPTGLDEHFAATIEPAFRHASALLRSRGVRVVNLSARSALGADIFEKVDWRTLAAAGAAAPAARAANLQ